VKLLRWRRSNAGGLGAAMATTEVMPCSVARLRYSFDAAGERVGRKRSKMEMWRRWGSLSRTGASNAVLMPVVACAVRATATRGCGWPPHGGSALRRSATETVQFSSSVTRC